MWVDIPELEQSFKRDQERYVRLAKVAKELLSEATRKTGIRCEVSSRAKDLESFVKKAFRKQYADPMRQIRDRAGVRIIVTYEHQVALVAKLIREIFEVVAEEDKHETLSADKLGYLGHHLDVQLLPGSTQGAQELEGLPCEIQVHTKLQNVWAEVSHELIYKARPSPPKMIERRILRLQTFVELFDEEVTRARKEILALPGKDAARLLENLDQHFYRFAGRDYDSELSLQILSTLGTLFDQEELDRIDQIIDVFITIHAERLQLLYEAHRNLQEPVELLLFQPEALLVFERLEHDPFILEEEWAKHYPPNLLEQLAIMWGKPYQTVG